ncbi:MAG: Arc family DNA-binding protein [Desulfobacterales bacterium]
MMSVNLSIKNVPDKIAEQLKMRAAKNHRSLQGELMSIVEAAVANNETMTPLELLSEIRSMGLSTPSESRDMVRDDRDAR